VSLVVIGVETRLREAVFVAMCQLMHIMVQHLHGGASKVEVRLKNHVMGPQRK
jgi:hypothetical protein